jgi:hypothetical protein
VFYIAEESIRQYGYYLLSAQLLIFYTVLMVDKSYFVIYATQWDVQKKVLGNSPNGPTGADMCRTRVKESQMKQWKQHIKKHIWKES